MSKWNLVTHTTPTREYAYLGFQVIGKLVAPPPIPERHRHGAFGGRLSHDVLVQLFNSVDGGKCGPQNLEHFTRVERILAKRECRDGGVWRARS